MQKGGSSHPNSITLTGDNTVTFSVAHVWHDSMPGPNGQKGLIVSLRLTFTKDIPADFKVHGIRVTKSGDEKDLWEVKGEKVDQHDSSNRNQKQLSVDARDGPASSRWPGGTSLDFTLDVGNHQTLTLKGAKIGNVF